MADTLKQSELESLLKVVGEKPPSPAAPRPAASGVTNYDFKRPERVGKEQIRALERLHEVFARNVSAALSSQMRTLIDCRLLGMEQATYQKFTLGVSNPTCFNLIRAPELEGELILDINPRLVFGMFDKLTGGGSARFEAPARALSELEWKVMRPTLNRVLEQLRNAWESLAPMRFEWASHETNPQLAQSIAPNEPVVLISFEMTLSAEQNGRMTLCLPHNLIEPVLSRISGLWLGNKVHRDEHTRDSIRGRLATAPVELTCTLEPVHMSLKELSELEVGHIITLSHPVDTPLLIELDGQPTFLGKLGQLKSRGTTCVRITGEA